MYLGIEIGGTKLQLGVGPGDGTLASLWRGTVNPSKGGQGIRRQLIAAVPELLAQAGMVAGQLLSVGVGFGGPVDDATRTVLKSHQIEGWDNFPLADWISDLLGLPAVLGNDADVAGLAETLFGAGKGLSPIFYITIGSGIGGGLIIDGEIYRGCGRGAAEIGHLQARLMPDGRTVESVASGWGIALQAQDELRFMGEGQGQLNSLRELVASNEGGLKKLENLPLLDPTALSSYSPVLSRMADWTGITVPIIVEAADKGDHLARAVLNRAIHTLGHAICHVLALLAPRRIVIGGGVSLLGEERLFKPLRAFVAERVFKPFAGCYDIVPAALGEEVVVHGALALARKRLPG